MQAGEAIAICAKRPDDATRDANWTLAACKLEVTVAGVNVASPKPGMCQDHFVVCEDTPTVWIDGHTVRLDPRLVRQFVLIKPGTGYVTSNMLSKTSPR